MLHSAINRQGVSQSAPYEVSHSFGELAGQAGDFERFSQLVSFARLALKHVKFGRGSGRRKESGKGKAARLCMLFKAEAIALVVLLA